jgi:hypothetical protein
MAQSLFIGQTECLILKPYDVIKWVLLAYGSGLWSVQIRSAKNRSEGVCIRGHWLPFSADNSLYSVYFYRLDPGANKTRLCLEHVQ